MALFLVAFACSGIRPYIRFSLLFPFQPWLLRYLSCLPSILSSHSFFKYKNRYIWLFWILLQHLEWMGLELDAINKIPIFFSCFFYILPKHKWNLLSYIPRRLHFTYYYFTGIRYDFVYRLHCRSTYAYATWKYAWNQWKNRFFFQEKIIIAVRSIPSYSIKRGSFITHKRTSREIDVRFFDGRWIIKFYDTWSFYEFMPHKHVHIHAYITIFINLLGLQVTQTPKYVVLRNKTLPMGQVKRYIFGINVDGVPFFFSLLIRHE